VARSAVVFTVLVLPGISVRPRTDRVRPPLKRRSVGAAGPDEDEEDHDVPELGAGAGCGLCCGSVCDCWPSAQYTHKTAHTLTFTSVFRQSSWEMLGSLLDSTDQFNLNKLYGPQPTRGYALVGTHKLAHTEVRVQRTLAPAPL